MVCILCDSKTKTTNSRSSAGGYQTWRRHTCKRCYAVFTTRESLDMSTSYRIELRDGSLVAFSRDALFVSILEALKHLPNHIDNAGAITTTVITKIQSKKRLVISRDELVEVCATTLRRFNIGASHIYKSQHTR